MPQTGPTPAACDRPCPRRREARILDGTLRVQVFSLVEDGRKRGRRPAHLVTRPRSDIVGAIGNTPLVKLERVSKATGCTILGKAEFMNPGQSVKDRTALFIGEDAVNTGRMR